MKMLRLAIVLCFLLFLSLMQFGCQQQKQLPSSKIDTSRSHSNKKVSTIVVPATVNGKWKAVKIAVIDKKVANESIYTIPIGGKITLPESTISIEIETFLPAFIMEGSSMTSASNELTNPAVKVIISDTGTSVLKGWMFAKYPTTHSFMHPRFSFTLIGAVPANPR